MLATEIKKGRSKQGMTQAELARRVNVSQNTISQYEKGRRTPSVKTLYAISKALNIPIDMVITEV